MRLRLQNLLLAILCMNWATIQATGRVQTVMKSLNIWGPKTDTLEGLMKKGLTDKAKMTISMTLNEQGMDILTFQNKELSKINLSYNNATQTYKALGQVYMDTLYKTTFTNMGIGIYGRSEPLSKNLRLVLTAVSKHKTLTGIEQENLKNFLEGIIEQNKQKDPSAKSKMWWIINLLIPEPTVEGIKFLLELLDENGNILVTNLYKQIQQIKITDSAPQQSTESIPTEKTALYQFVFQDGNVTRSNNDRETQAKNFWNSDRNLITLLKNKSK